MMTNKETKEKLNAFKNEIASELGVDLTKKDLTAREAGSVGGEMVKRMIENYENNHKSL